MIKSAVISQYLKKVDANMPDGLGKALLEEHLHLEPVLSPSAASHTYDWKIDNFKNWHENQPKKVTTSQFITTGTENQSVHFKMWLLSNGLDPLTGRVNLTLHLQYASKKFLKLIPVEVLISVIDENGVKRHTQEFIMSVICIPRNLTVARYFYRTRESDMKAAKNNNFYLIIDNSATFHFEMRYLSLDEFTDRMELYRDEAKMIRKAKKEEARARKKELRAKKQSSGVHRRLILPKIWHAIRNLTQI